MRIQSVETLSGHELDLAVATVLGYKNLRVRVDPHIPGFSYLVFGPESKYVRLSDLNYSDNWELAGPLIDAEGISLRYLPASVNPHFRWKANCRWSYVYGSYALEAAMRVLVASRSGISLNVPDIPDVPDIV